jgi:hypothetical protein
MTLPQVIGELVPGAFLDLVCQVREKYQIPDPGPDKDILPEMLARDLPFEEIRAELCEGLRRVMPEASPITRLLKPFLDLPADLPLSVALKDLAEKMPDEWTVGSTIHRYIEGLHEPQVQQMADMLLAYALTGDTTTAPQDWFGGVFTIPLPGLPMIGVIASEYSDLGPLVNQFRQKHHEAFPQRRRRLAGSAVNAAASLRLRLEGYKLKDIADIYIANHPSEFPKDPLSLKYKATKRQLEERIKKQMDRLQAILNIHRDT